VGDPRSPVLLSREEIDDVIGNWADEIKYKQKIKLLVNEVEASLLLAFE